MSIILYLYIEYTYKESSIVNVNRPVLASVRCNYDEKLAFPSSYYVNTKCSCVRLEWFHLNYSHNVWAKNLKRHCFCD